MTVCVVTPMNAIRGVRPARRSSSTGSADEIEIAKPMLFADPGSAIAVLMPMTRPSTSTSGPPELPGLIAASVWIASTSVSVPAMCTVRPRPETMPEVTVGLPGDSERVADRDDGVADLQGVGVAELHRRETGAVDLDDGEVLGAVLADDASAHGRRRRSSVTTSCVAGGGRLGVRDVRVGDDDAVGRDDEAGSGARLAVDWTRDRAVTSMRTTAGSTLARIDANVARLRQRGRRPCRAAVGSEARARRSWSSR